jgi:outer membrane receptor protein involved in Fe transport
VDGAAIVNWTLMSREILEGFDASVGIYNLFGTDYAHPSGPEHRQEGIPQAGRSLRVKLTYHF